MKCHGLRGFSCVLAFLFMFLSCSTTPASRTAESQDLLLVREFEGGRLYKAGKIDVLELQGSYYEMGRQYGGLMKDKLGECYDRLIKKPTIDSGAATFDEIKMILTDPLWAFTPRRQKEIVRGASDTSGMTRDKLLMAVQSTAVAMTFHDASFGGCSFISAWGDYTKDGKVVLGRNFDFPKLFTDNSQYLTLVVYKPTEGANSIAVLGYMNMVSLLSGLNDKDLYIEINDGSESIGGAIFTNRLHILSELLDFMWDSDTFEYLDAALHTARINFPLILNVSTPDASYSYEDAPYLVRRRSAEEPGLLMATNSYMLDGWGIVTKDTTDSLLRYRNLTNLGNKYKGEIDAGAMRKILEQPIKNKDGSMGDGATLLYIEKGAQELTNYQYVAVPEDKEMWIRAPGYNDWTYVDLGRLFSED